MLTMSAENRKNGPMARLSHDAVLAAWLGELSSPNTRSSYRLDLEVFARWCAERGSVPLVADATSIVEFQRERSNDGDSAATVRRRWSALSSFFQSAIAQGARHDNPARGAVRPASRDASTTTALLSQREVDEHRRNAAAIDPRLAALVALITLDGFKLGEALAIDVEHLSGRPPHLWVAIVRRAGAGRVQLVEESAHAVHAVARPRTKGPLFISARATAPTATPSRLTRFGADHLIRQLNQDDEGRVTANALRRYHMVMSRAAGAEPDHIRERMGLADVRSVRRQLPHDA